MEIRRLWFSICIVDLYFPVSVPSPTLWANPASSLSRWVCGSRTCPSYASSGPCTSPSRSTRAAVRRPARGPTPWTTASSTRTTSSTRTPESRPQRRRRRARHHRHATGRPRTRGCTSHSASRYENPKPLPSSLKDQGAEPWRCLGFFCFVFFIS